eukprot:scaffold197248_cov30-Tisochrysis_lutea.AAC.2
MAVEPNAEICGVIVAGEHVIAGVHPHRGGAVAAHVGEAAAARASGEAPQPAVGRLLHKGVRVEGHRIEGGGVVVEDALVAAGRRTCTVLTRAEP